jgi:hypothetical protein
MATRMQQRRGTAAQWTSTNDGDGPILEVGEIGFETDTGKFKIGDGTNRWIDLDYFLDESEIDSITGDYVLSSTLGQNNGVATLDGSGKLTSSQIPTSLATTNYVDTAVSNLIDAAPGTLDTLNELAAAINDDASFASTITTSLGNKQDVVTGVSSTEIGYLSNVTSDIQSQLDDKLESADLDEAAQDAINTALVAGTGIDKIYDDNANTITLNIDSTVTTNDGTQTLTNKAISGTSNSLSNIPNSALDYDHITINGSSVSLGGSTTIDALPSQTGEGGKYLTTDGNNPSWSTIDLSSKQDVVAGVSDTEIGYLSNVTSDIQNQIDGKLSTSGGTMTGDITLPGSPTQALHAATKAYVDGIAEGLHIHASCVAATTANLSISADLEPGDIVDGVTLAEGDRVLVKSQTNTAQNGIYVVQSSGAALRASDFNEPQEVDGGDFVFVTGGTLHDNTGWVQTTTNVVTIGTDPIVFTQFSGAGTYTAGNGLELNETVFSIDTDITVDTSTAQTLTNKTIDAASNTISNIPNSSLENSDVTINGESVSLGGSIAIPTGATAQLVSSNISLQHNYNYFVDTSAARTLTLASAPSLGDTIAIIDAAGLAATNKITVDSNGGKINGTVQDLEIDMNNAAVVLIYTGSSYGWRVG